MERIDVGAEADSAAGARAATPPAVGDVPRVPVPWTRGDAPWFETHPKRLEAELEALDAIGARYERVADAFARGIAQLRVWQTVEGGEHELLVTFPSAYPFFRVRVDAPSLTLAHHQNPFNHNLCLLGRSTGAWSVNDTVASLLKEQLPRVFAAGTATTKAEVARLEQLQGEPFADYYAYAPAMFVIDGSWRLPESDTYGTLSIGLISADKGVEFPILRACVLKVFGERDQLLYEAPNGIVALFGPSNSTMFNGRWSRVDAPPNVGEAEALFSIAAEADKQPHKLETLRLPDPPFAVSVRAVVFPDEHVWRERTGTGWVFSVRVTRVTDGQLQQRSTRRFKGSPLRKVPHSDYYFARAGRMGVTDTLERAPELHASTTTSVAVFGLGCIGAPSAIEFAKAQVGSLDLVDHDIVDPATAVRWPLGLASAGQFKAHALGNFLMQNWPHTHTAPHVHHLGAVPLPNDPPSSDPQLLASITRAGTLIYDATAEFGVANYLSTYAAEHGLPYVAVSGTHGGWGGRVFLAVPGSGLACWECLQRHLGTGTVPAPPAIGTGTTAALVQPAGCSDPTFTASGVDTAALAMAGVRTALGVLLCDTANGYPAPDWNVATIAFRDDTGLTVNSEVHIQRLEPHFDCQRCALSASTPEADARQNAR